LILQFYNSYIFAQAATGDINCRYVYGYIFWMAKHAFKGKDPKEVAIAALIHHHATSDINCGKLSSWHL
jgi:hypothetical protein